jgi:hypothetical protein
VAALLGIVRRRGPDALRAALRLALLACIPALMILETVIMVVYGM